MCGQGFMIGPGVGKNVISLIVDGKTCLPEEAHHCFRYDRLRIWPCGNSQRSDIAASAVQPCILL